jgi:parallel beta-helix repeat protein
MNTFSRNLLMAVIKITIAVGLSINAIAQKFVHPGIDQSIQDLQHMKSLVLRGEQPYKGAFDRMKATLDTGCKVQPHAHVLRGPYGKPNIGGNDLSKSASMAYNYALAWYITSDKSYAGKAIEILNAWSPVLWDFDYNDAKLLAAWTGHQLCNAAEILRYTNSGWQQKDMDSFSKMLMTVYYPLMRYYYPQANGNWDGAIIHSIMAIAVFTDNRKMFDNAVDHFLHAPVNGSIFKYIYPSGQCQESTRDQGHVQLGLGEFAGAAQVAFTQGVDLFALADNRIALGYEYTAKFVLGEKPHCYGTISERAKELRDDYEYVYRHYTAQGVQMPYTKKAADVVRVKANRNVLTSVRLSYGKQQRAVSPKPSSIGYIAGAGAASIKNIPGDAIEVAPGQSMQKALDEAAGTGRWVIAKAGIHTLPAKLKMPSRVTLAGEGLSTILFLDPASGEREAIINSDNDMHDITIRDLVIECGLRTEPPSDPNSARSYRGGYNRGGILFRTLREGQMKNLNLVNLTVQNGTFNGVLINGASNVNITRCDFNENGVSVPPGQKLLHNLLLTHCTDVRIKDSRLATSPNGSGIALDHNKDVTITNCEIARNGYHGISVAESDNVSIANNLIEANDLCGVFVEFLFKGSNNITTTKNIIQFNSGYGIASYAVKNIKVEQNTYAGNGNLSEQQKISEEKYIVMDREKFQVTKTL